MVATNETVRIDAARTHYRDLNAAVREAVAAGTRRIEIANASGQRYLGTGLGVPIAIDVTGTAGNDLGAFMDGPTITVHGNAQDGCGNTMNSGEITVHGRAGDILGLSARGGRIFVRDGVGYRVGIHMKEYEGLHAEIVIGGSAQDFLGEYMAGGVILVLGRDLPDGRHRSRFIGTGMHGGAIFLRGSVEEHQLGREVGVSEPDAGDSDLLGRLVGEYARRFEADAQQLLTGPFLKLTARSLRPYGRLYAY